MKITRRSIPFFLFFFFALNTSISGQIILSGPFDVCPGECYTYTHNSPNSASISWTWDFGANPAGLTAQVIGDDLQVCVSDNVISPNSYTVFVADFATGGTAWLQTNIGFSIDVEIIATGCIEYGEDVFLSTNIVDSTGTNWDYFWTGPNNLWSTNSTITISNLSQDKQGTFCVQVSNQNDCQGEACIDIIPTNFEIIPTSVIFCEYDSIWPPCQRVCANSQMTYEVSGAQPGADIQWQVFGAQEFEIDGNQITVDWGEPGQGEITAEISNGNDWIPFNFSCGEAAPIGDFPPFTGTGFVSIDGPQSSYNVTVISPDGTTQNLTVGNGTNFIPDLIGGTHILTVENNGLTYTCDFLITHVFNPQCNISGFYEEITHASDCNSCDGTVFIATFGFGGPFTYEWSNGATGATQYNLCPGIYTVTITDQMNCVEFMSVEIGCPTGCDASTTYCVDIIEDPKAQIASTPPADNDIIEICEGQTVFFQNESTDARYFHLGLWRF